jgi:glycosyltransferase involved in cell wall biosynthesis
MKMSFIIPSFRQAQFLSLCLDHIAAQNLPVADFEVRVYDNASDDGTVDILRSHPVKPIWVSQPDRGQAAAVNCGLREARGEIIAWVNADDYHPPGAISNVLAAFAANPTTDVIYGDAINVDDMGREIGRYPVEDWSYATLAQRNFLCQPAVFFRRRVTTEAGYLDESLHMALDYEYWLRLGRTCVFRRLPQVLAANRVHPASKTSRQPILGRRESLLASHRYTGQWSPAWLGSLASRVSEHFWGRIGLRSPTLTWFGKQFILPYYHARLRWLKNPF